MSFKGKEKVTGGDKGKRKWSGGDNDKTGQKRKNRGVLQFFEDRAYEVGDDEDEDSSDDSMWDYDFDEEEFVTEGEANKAPGKAPQYPCIPKEEEMSEEELEKMLEERYKAGSNFVTYAEDGYENKRSIERDMYVPSAKDPTIWKVKCMVGRERQSAFCLMQKYVDLNFLGTKLQVISAFAVDHVKGFIFIEADKQHDIYEACKGLCTIYPSRVIPVPPKEIHYLFSSRSKSNAISEGMWARVKNGKYKRDLAQVVAVNDLRKKVTVKLIPRIDLRAMADKFGGGVSAKRTATPAPRLISASELEEFRPLIQQRRDRDANQMFDVLDGMLLKDGYLYKKVSVDSLSLWGVMPTDDELLKFEPSKNDESNNDGQWLAQLFGEENKHIHATKKDKGGGKGGKEGGSCSSTVENNFEMHDLVFFGRKDFGVVVGTAKDDSIKVIKEGSEGPSVVSVKQRDLKSASFDKKLFTVLDQHAQTISINDIVRILDGPLKDRQGTVKKIYRGILFICDGSEQENYGYICAKAQLCEKVNISGKVTKEKNQGSEPGGPSGFEDLPSSPQCPLSPNNSWQEKDTRTNFNCQDNGIFSVGQLLRIKLGPLKGYLCRVLAVRRSEVTVKLDSQHKILTVKCDHLSEVRGRNAAISQGEDSESVKPFGFLAPQDGSSDWMDGTALSTDAEKWNAGGLSTERSSWSAFPSSSSLHQESGPTGPSNPADNDADKGTEGSPWEIKATKATPSQNSSWGATTADEKMVANNGSGGSWGSSRDDAGGSTEARNKIGASLENETSGWGNAGGKLDQPEASAWRKDAGASAWKDAAGSNDGQNDNWGNNKKDGDAGGWGKVGSSSNKGTGGNEEPSSGNASSAGQIDSWSKPKPPGVDGGTSWGKQDSTSWNKQGTSSLSKHDGGSSWGKQEEGSNGSKQNDGQPWDKKGGESSWGSGGGGAWVKQDGASGNKNDGESSWSKQDGESWGKQVGGSNGSKQNDGNSWGKKDGESSWGSEGGGAWGKQDGASGNKKDGESSWSKQTAGSTWGKKPDGNAEDQLEGREDQKDSSGNSKGGFGGWKNGGTEKSDADQDGSWGRGKSFDGGRGSGGRRGRGRGGGRGQYGGGRFDQQSQDSSGDFLEGNRSSWSDGQAGSWNKDMSTEGNRSSWSGGQAGSWNKDTSAEGNKGDSWGKKFVSGEDKESGWKKEWHANKETAETGDKSVEPDLNNKSSGWGSSNDGQSSGWNRSNVNEDAGNDQSTWAKGKSSDDKNTSPWNTGNASNENQASEWGKNDNSSSKKPSDDKSSGWKNTSGSSTGWGKSNWSGGGTDDTGGNQGSTWSSKSNWSSGHGFGGNDDQNDSGSGRGRSGSWRGGREGRGDRGGFRGRGRSDRGGFGGRGRGGFGGRDGGDREGGFRGRGGGFRGRGRGDWNNRNDSGDDGTSDWRNGSNGNSEGWKSSSGGGTWSSGGGGWKSSTEAKIDNGRSSAAGDDWKNSNASTGGSWGSGWNNSKGDADGAGNNQAGGGWKSSTEAKTDHGQSSAGGSNWKTSNSPNEDVSTAWGQGSGKGDTAGSTQPSWGKAGGSSWGSAPGSEGPVNSWGKAAGSSWGTAAGGENSSANQENKSEAAGGWKTNDSNPRGGSSGSWGQ